MLILVVFLFVMVSYMMKKREELPMEKTNTVLTN